MERIESASNAKIKRAVSAYLSAFLGAASPFFAVFVIMKLPFLDDNGGKLYN